MDFCLSAMTTSPSSIYLLTKSLQRNRIPGQTVFRRITIGCSSIFAASSRTSTGRRHLAFHFLRFEVMGASVRPLDGNQGEKKRADGLVEGHAYSLIAVRVVQNQDGEEVRLVQLRNPWGSLEWNGRWSDTDQESWGTLSEDVRVSLGPRKDGDGMFYLEWGDFVEIMLDVIVSAKTMV